MIYLKNNRIWLSSPHLGGDEMEFIREAFESNWIAPLGPQVDGFEKDLVNYTGTDHCLALSSGTAAIHLALILLGVSKGDYILCPTFTFCASANPIRYQDAEPVFIESEPETWNLSPDFLEESLKDLNKKNKKPKALILVHLYGMPAKINEILSICRTYDIPIIEDAAEALGSFHHGKHVGTTGTFGILSFNGNKIITTSGGGALISSDRSLIDRGRYLSTQAREDAPHYEHTDIGYNYRMSNIVAAIGRGQMRVLEKRIEHRRKNFAYYQKKIGHIDGISFLQEPKNYFTNRWLTTILVNPENTGGLTRESLRLALEKENIEARPLWKPMHLQPVFAKYPYYGEGLSEKLFDQGLCLPSGSNLQETDMERVIKIINNTMNS